MSATTVGMTSQRGPSRARERAATWLALALLLLGLAVVYLAMLVLSVPIFGTAHVNGRPSTALAILVTVIVAAAVQPLHQRTRLLARRLLGVGSTSRYEALAGFGNRLAALTGTDDTLAEVAAITGVALGARRADVWLAVEGEWFLAGTWGGSDGAPDRPETADAYVELRRGQGESAHVLGALSVTTAGGGPLSPPDEQLLDDMASQAVLVVRTVGQTAQLRARLSVIARQKDELDAARQRMHTAAEVEQRRLEQDLVDGPLYQLGLIAATLPRLRSQPGTLPDLQRLADAAIEGLRDLARGVYPPVLRDSGLAAAFRSRYRRSAAPVTVRATGGTARLPPETELTAYVAGCDAVAAALGHGATRIAVDLARMSDVLVLIVGDDGEPLASGRRADLQGAADRIIATGGSFGFAAPRPNGANAVLEMTLPVPAAGRTA